MAGYDKETVEIVKGMLTENTGSHMLDSGGAYGRNWQRNQERDFESEAPVTLDVAHGYIDVTINVFHYLCENLTFDEDMQEMYEEFIGDSEKCHLNDLEDFADHMHDNFEASGIYGDGKPFVVNTYNEENLLSQTLQFVYMEWNNETYIGLQVHGGCDVRGGYTAPKWFTYSGHSWEGVSFLTDYLGGYMTSIYAVDSDGDSPDGLNWTTDDAYHWYRDGACGLGAGTQLEDYEWVCLEDFAAEDIPANGLDLLRRIGEGERLPNQYRDDEGCLREDVVVYCQDTNRAWICDDGDIFELKV